MGFWDRLIKRRVETVAEEILRERMPGIIRQAVRDVVADLWRTDWRFRFIKWTQWELQKADPRLSGEASFAMAKAAINQHLRDEGIDFGDKRFAWDEEGAREVAHAYQIDHWEPLP